MVVVLPLVRRRGFTLIEIVIVILIIGVISGIAAPAYEKYRKYSYTRACFANQKTVSGALQNYNLDKNLKRTDLPGVMNDLVNEGYIRTVPNDPGEAPGSSSDYVYTGSGHSIKCIKHGPLP
jgi:prepilin-type N-terminal cleavage/methylation domain-containing protein